MATIIRMPEVLAGTSEAVIAEWQVTEGAEVNVGDVLAEIETEKALVEYAAEDAGVLGKLLANTGELIAVGTPIAVLLDHAGEEADLDELLGGDAPAAGPEAEPAAEAAPDRGTPATHTPAPTPPAEPATAPESATDPGPVAAPAPAAAPSSAEAERRGRIFISPLARKLAKERGIDISELTGSGPGGRIVRRDVEAYQPAAPAPQPAQAPTVPAATGPEDEEVEEFPHTGMRRAIARRLTESKSTVPHFYLTADCRVDDLLALRKQVNEAGTVKISVNDFVLKAVSAAFAAVPEANVVWTETALRRYRRVDVAVAVATDTGLLTPVVRGVDTASLSAVSRQVGDLVERARAGRLRQDELEGGTFTVSNLGMYGTREFSAILNPPQSGILAVGAALPQPVVTDGELGVATVMRCTLSADHRAVDGALAAQWLAAFQHAIENPLLMLT